MIPVRVPAGFQPHIVRDDVRLAPGDRLYDQPCPVCDNPLGGELVALVAVGIHPDDRKESGWTNGAAVAVHTACVAPSEAGRG